MGWLAPAFSTRKLTTFSRANRSRSSWPMNTLQVVLPGAGASSLSKNAW
ncbi:MAG TPA: hypothetical protein VKH82_15495 [Candidatus Binatia bacterium]|nr:hypothetical protein [Candidatus Binatia bacterium]